MKNRYFNLPFRLLGFLVLPLLVLAGCDEENVLEPDPDPSQHTVAAYDTTDQTSNGGKTIIEVEDVDGGGIGYEDADGNALTDVTWTSGNVYVLKGRVFVNEGQTLTIEPGTIIQGRYSANALQASALIVAQGGTIMAEGEPDNPIIFTAEGDNVSDPDDILFNRRGDWGGVIILGKAPTNTTPGVINIEGISSDITRGQYGCGSAGVTCDPNDNSGVFKYVSIRYGGQSIGENNEINGLTMGGVGNGTTIEYVEVFNNQDDGFEWFGGTVNTKHLVSAFNGDDAFDIDQGWSGDNQFWFAIQAADPAGHTGEHDSGDSDFGGEDSKPVATPQIYNATYIGSGLDGEGGQAFLLRDNWGGAYYNSIFAGFPGEAVRIEDLDDTDTGDSRARFEDGTLRLENNIFYNFGAGDTFAALTANEGAFGQTVSGYLDQNNRLTDPQLAGISRTEGSGGLSPLPQSGGPAYSNLASYPSGSFYEQVSYVGAFGSENWARGWTFLDAAGFLAN